MRALLVIAALVLPLGASAQPTAGFSRPMSTVECPCIQRDPAPNWTKTGFFEGIWTWEQVGPMTISSLLIDESGSSNFLDVRSLNQITNLGTRVPQQCGAHEQGTSHNSMLCLAPDCAPGDFCPINAPFTAGCWLRPDDVVDERWVLSSDRHDGLGAGYNIGWKQTSSGTGNFVFQIDPTAGAGETELLTATGYAPAVAHHHQVARYVYQTPNADGTMQQLIDGTLDAATAVVQPIQLCQEFGGASPYFVLGPGLFNTTLTGVWDECFYANAALDDASVCRIAVCGIDGCGCSCDAGTPSLYDAAPSHTSFGGPLTCTLPACDATTPSTILPTTTTTSTTTSTTL